MKVEIEWKERGNFQTKTFKDQNACMQWCRTNCKNIYSLNGIYTFCQVLSHYDIMDCLNGRNINNLDVIEKALEVWGGNV